MKYNAQNESKNQCKNDYAKHYCAIGFICLLQIFLVSISSISFAVYVTLSPRQPEELTRKPSVTYKLKLNGGDIKAVQGDSGHSQINMVTDVYSHIIDDDRRKNAELFEEAFYEKKDLDPSMHAHAADKTVELPTDVDAELFPAAVHVKEGKKLWI